MPYYLKKIESPIGKLTLVADEENLTELTWGSESRQRGTDGFLDGENHPVIKKTAKQLREYFAGARKDFDIPLKLDGTGFQKKVWKALMGIPYGGVTSYSQIAVKISAPKACRAVGMANGRNKIPIIIPCHRVIGKDGTLTGFGGGLDIKEFLLNLEAKNRRTP
jgi:methylated-DNA-[protein]-cysteine S-methyltransferase